ncbi:Hypothetical predicted protein [Podarcis lilfordi]|uniref:Uncharacterized protein n=1 Tax=Podarcis lilfordi TaxID=74358 RepID=A0AA35NV12_9SAUR|nr:Hypothetical predicted protein [Podarcis lilfordi]
MAGGTTFPAVHCEEARAVLTPAPVLREKPQCVPVSLDSQTTWVEASGSLMFHQHAFCLICHKQITLR